MSPFQKVQWTVHAQVRVKMGKRWEWANMIVPALSADLAMAFAGAISTARKTRRVAVEAATIATEHVIDTTWTDFKQQRKR